MVRCEILKGFQRKGAKAQRAQRFFVWGVRQPQALRVALNHFDFSLRPLRLCVFALDFQISQGARA